MSLLKDRAQSAARHYKMYLVKGPVYTSANDE